MLGDVGGLGLRDQRIGFVLIHLAAADHVLDQIARAFNREGAQAGCGADHVAHGAGHPAPSFKADLVGTRRHFCSRVPRVGRPVTGAAPRGGSGWRRVAFRERFVVSLRQIGHRWSALLPPYMEVEVVAKRNSEARAVTSPHHPSGPRPPERG